MLEQEENHLGTDEESSKESSLQSSLQDSSLTELGGKMASAGIGAGMVMVSDIDKAASGMFVHTVIL